MTDTLETLVHRAKTGDGQALQEVVREIQDQVYGLSVRMLWDPTDAEDAMQEILVKVITNLGSFRHESSFSTWVYRIAANHLLSVRKQFLGRQGISFEEYEAYSVGGPPDPGTTPESSPHDDLIVKEMMIACTQGVLQCLKPDLRIVYILGEVLQMPSTEGGPILDIGPAAFRQRLSRARILMRDFMVRNCGLVNESAACRCSREVDASIQAKFIDPKKLRFASHPVTDEAPVSTTSTPADDFERVAALFRSHPKYAAPLTFLQKMQGLVR